jgi:hypothetical protein
MKAGHWCEISLLMIADALVCLKERRKPFAFAVLRDMDPCRPAFGPSEMQSVTQSHAFSTKLPWVALGLVVLYVAAIMAGLYRAELWSQVEYLWLHGVDLFNWYQIQAAGQTDTFGRDLIVTESHRLRYALVYPLYIIADVLGISPHLVFTYVVPLAVAGTVWAIARVIEAQSASPLSRLAWLALLPLAAIFFFMGGRLVLAYLGYALLLRTLIGSPVQSLALRLLVIAAALWLTSVASGPFVLGLATTFLVGVIDLAKARGGIARLLGITPPVFAFLLYHHDLGVTLFKNIAFYGGGWTGAVQMLDHGFGSVLLGLPFGLPELIALAVVGAGLAFVLWRALRCVHDPRLPLILLLALAMGAFGGSTLSLAILPIMASVGVALQILSARILPVT